VTTFVAHCFALVYLSPRARNFVAYESCAAPSHPLMAHRDLRLDLNLDPQISLYHFLKVLATAT
jgi:hypothetical protein